MLIKFSAENYKSIAAATEFNMAARSSEKMINGATIPVKLPGSGVERLLASTAIYGANASGKTNILLAINAMDAAVAQSQTHWKINQSIPFDPHVSLRDSPTTLEMQMVIDNVRYRYGIRATRKSFVGEWLYSYPVGRERLLFNRSGAVKHDGDIVPVEFGANLTGDKRTLESIQSRVRPNSLFLSAAAQDNQLECKIISLWFAEKIRYGEIELDDFYRAETSIFAFNYPGFKDLLLSLMRLSDQTIRDITITYDGPAEEAKSLTDDYQSIYDSSDKFDISFTVSDDNGADYILPFDCQSRGIKKLYNLGAIIVNALAWGQTIVIDELESSLHPHVAAKILALFQSRSSNPRGAQLIFTTHETRLLNLQHLRRDQVWFCEKSSLSTHLYPLSDFSPRKDENLETGYLRGRYGAVPKAALDPQWVKSIQTLRKAIEKIDG